MPLQQQNRSLSVSTPLGDDVLLLRGMTATEELGRLFEYELDLISDVIDVKHEDLLGQSVTVRLDLLDGKQRYFNGIVNRFSQVGFDGDLAVYQATLVPWTWFLTRTADCRIFQEQTVPDIVKAIFREHGYTDFEERLSGSYRQWVYCVQYRETDFNFISRLMEQEGMYYYFTHEDGKHKLILADSYSAHGPASGADEIPYYPPDATSLRERDHISDWSVVQAVQPGTFAHTDFDFTAPRKSLLAKRSNPKSHEHADLEVYDYPGEYVETGDGESYARVRLEELHAGYETARAEGNARGLAMGHLFNLTKYPRDDQNREYLIVSAHYRLQSDVFGSGADLPQGDVFQCSLTAIDAQTAFRPSRTTPKPIVQGPQTAIVVGKAGEEIWTDQYGRVKVQFHWDRYGKSDENSSCWVRVSHPWAGKNWGAIAIPRIGQEVIIDFLEGDPDQPIITGRVYNGDQMPPWGLPANMTQSGILSRSTKAGSEANANAIRMEDKKGSEQLWIHAEKNQDIEVENDETHWVGNDRHKTIDHDETSHIKHDRTETVDNNETITVHGNRTETVDKNETITIHQNRTETVDKEETITVHGGRTETVDKNETITISGGRTESVAKDESISIGANRSENVGKDESISIGGARTESVAKSESVSVGEARSVSIGKDDSLSVGKNLSINAGDSITITTGSASISMKKDGTIAIKGKDISIQGSGKINIKASSDITMKGSKILQN
ncbi:type VI secretion system Vgr family protein [Thiocapsa bogorovii]|uniref:type VI secretion system Vgr family protein n=1 Tax=Thiocapsa bogorovii TaxID=521689 RepID=UPI001E44EEA3|nr:type VI secretion system tip protein VgrG [Thiocapsa bogorovii]UHD16102.1 type VI secretion system tip protein VgrG [Thiocapsa bogorovii]